MDRPRRLVGAMLESTGFHPGRRARDHLRVLAAADGIPARRVDEVLELAGLTAAAGRPVRQFSLGMRQRLGLAVAMLGDPQVLVLEGIAGQLLGSSLARWLPFYASEPHARSNLPATARLLPQWGGGLMLLAYAPVFATAAVFTTLRRDVT